MLSIEAPTVPRRAPAALLGSSSSLAKRNGAAGGAVGAAGATGASLGMIGIVKAVLIGAVAGAITMTGAVEVNERLSASPTVTPSAAMPSVPMVRVAEHERRNDLTPLPAATAPPASPLVVPPARSGNVRPPEVTPQREGAASASSARFEPSDAPGDLASRARAEREVLQRARAALQAGDPARALRAVDAARQTFPAGILTQEREVLAIEALSAAGRPTEARARATWFLVQFPDSPHRAHVERFAR